MTIDPTFSETVSTSRYQVQLTAYWDGSLHVRERASSYFVVEGTAGLAFGWEVKAKQADFDQLRLERYDSTSPERDTTDYCGEAVAHVSATSTDYGGKAIDHVESVAASRKAE